MKKLTFCMISSIIILFGSCKNSKSPVTAEPEVKETNSAEANKALIRKYFAAIDSAGKTFNADILDDYMTTDFVEHNPFPGLPPNRDGWKQAFLMFAKGAPGHHVVDDLIAEGDKVAGRITAHGKHTGELFGIPPTNKEFSMTGLAIWRIQNGKIIEHWNQTDQVGMMTQLGVMPHQPHN